MTQLPDVLQHPHNTHFLMVREDLIGLCEDAPDPKCAGAILALFEYWTRVKLANKSQAEIDNAIALKEGVGPTQDTTLWIYKTMSQMQQETLGLFCEKKLCDNRKWLVEQAGYLFQRTNPKHKWDRTLQYRLNTPQVQEALREWDNARTAPSKPQNRSFEAADLPNGNGQTAGTIPETTKENTNREQASPPGLGSFNISVSDCRPFHKDIPCSPSSSSFNEGEQGLLEDVICSLFKRKALPKYARTAFSKPMWHDKNIPGEDLPTPNSAFKENALFRDWLTLDVFPWSEDARGQPNLRKFANGVHKGYDRFQRYVEAYNAAAQQSKRFTSLEVPDGGFVVANQEWLNELENTLCTVEGE